MNINNSMASRVNGAWLRRPVGGEESDNPLDGEAIEVARAGAAGVGVVPHE